MSGEEIINSYGSNIINILIMPLIGGSIIFMGIIPFLIEEGLGISTGSWIYAIITILLGIIVVIFPFKYKMHLKPRSVVYSRVWGDKEVSLEGVVQIGNIEQRLMNGAPIAINKVELIRPDGSRFNLSLRNVGFDQGKEIIGYIQQNLPFN